MLFNSVEFLLFFPLVTTIYFVLPAKTKHIWLLISSYYFYMCWNVKYVLLIFMSTLITYISGILIEKVKTTNLEIKRKDSLKKWIVAGSFISNLGILFFFKYMNFTIGILMKVLWNINIQPRISEFNILLPVGISFYTFQALSYTMDVYRGEIYAEKNFLEYALFVSFFPQLVAGPIERSKNLLKQMAKPVSFDFGAFEEGILLMLWGFFLKIVVADRIAIFVDTVYGNIEKYPGCYIAVASALFAFQIYCDFAGYSTIAMGAAKILGINLMENFNAPYLSFSVADFWRNWHISLTSWFRDYLYFPLGGSKKGKLRKYLNIMIVFTISGLWHGAQFSYVVWGMLNGAYQVIGEVLKPFRRNLASCLHLNRDSIGSKLVKVVTIFILIDFSWIFFRADRLKSAINIIKAMVSVYNPWILFDGSLYECGLDSKNFTLMLICILILLVADICKKKGIQIRGVITCQDAWFRILIISFGILAIMTFGIYGGGYDKAAFIYFQF